MECKMEVVRVRSLVVFTWLNTSIDPEPDVWTHWVKQVQQAKLQAPDSGKIFRTFVVSDGGAPNAKQRTELFSDVRRGEGLAAVVTSALNHPLRRSIATAISWFNPGFRAFPPEKSRAAFEHVGCLRAEEQEAVWDALLRMQLELPLVRTLQTVAKQMDLPGSLHRRPVNDEAG